LRRLRTAVAELSPFPASKASRHPVLLSPSHKPVENGENGKVYMEGFLLKQKTNTQ
jgi:hypothetical protein